MTGVTHGPDARCPRKPHRRPAGRLRHWLGPCPPWPAAAARRMAGGQPVAPGLARRQGLLRRAHARRITPGAAVAGAAPACLAAPPRFRAGRGDAALPGSDRGAAMPDHAPDAGAGRSLGRPGVRPGRLCRRQSGGDVGLGKSRQGRARLGRGVGPVAPSRGRRRRAHRRPGRRGLGARVGADLLRHTAASRAGRSAAAARAAVQPAASAEPGAGTAGVGDARTRPARRHAPPARTGGAAAGRGAAPGLPPLAQRDVAATHRGRAKMPTPGRCAMRWKTPGATPASTAAGSALRCSWTRR